MDQFHKERDTMTPGNIYVAFDMKLLKFLFILERKIMLLNNFPPFLNQLEEEIYSPNSPIWDPEFKAQPISFPLETNKINRGNNS